MLAVFGDFGGVLEMLSLLFSIFISPWASFKFDFKAVQKLYMVLTKRNDLFKSTNKWKNLNKKMKMLEAAKAKGTQENTRISHIRHGKLSACSQASLFMRQLFCRAFDGDDPMSIDNKIARWFTIG